MGFRQSPVDCIYLFLELGTRIYTHTHIHTYNFRNHDEEYGNILNSLWLVAITFWCIGYGDIVPNTYCGRGICLIVGSSVRIIFEGGHPNLSIRFDQKSGAAIIFVSMNGKCVYNWFSFIGFGGTEKLTLCFGSKPKQNISFSVPPIGFHAVSHLFQSFIDYFYNTV